MTRPTLNTGDVWADSLANAAGYPILDGADEYGHGDKVPDEWLSDDSGMIKARFYSWYDRVKVTAGSGLSVNYTGAPIRLPDGSSVTLSAGSLTLPNNASGFIYIDNEGSISFGSTLPPERILLSTYTTLSGSIVELNDVRRQVSEVVTPESISSAAIFEIGDIKVSARINPSEGWLLCDGSEYAVADYPSLYSAIGDAYNLTTTPVGFFRIPDARNRAIVGAGVTHPLGDSWGDETKRLTIAELPSHSHAVSQTPHTHGVNDSGHTHGVNDSGHNHGLESTIAFNRRDYNNNYGSGNGLGLGPLLGRGTEVAATGISIRNNSSGVSLASANASVTIQNQGGGAAFNLAQPSVAMNVFIRAT